MNLGSLSDSSDDETMFHMAILVGNVYYSESVEGESSTAKSKKKMIYRNRVEANNLLMRHYFDEGCLYTPEQFRRRYRMRRPLFLRIVDGILNYSEVPLSSHFNYFKTRLDYTGKQSFTAIQKCSSAMRLLAYEITSDAFDEYFQMAESTSNESLDNFCKCVIDLYKNVYLRKPTHEDVQRIYAKHDERHGFPGMLGSIDCMHWAWEKCPNAWKGQYTSGDQGHPTVILEAVASYDLWIWHAYFGVAGSNNDINVLNVSPLFRELLNDIAPPTQFQVNNNTYQKGYYLADGIYPDWATFVKSFSHPPDDKHKKFKKIQETARKDIERAFGMLQGRFWILKNAERFYEVNRLRRVMYTCIILHNMIVEDNGYNISDCEKYYTPIPREQKTSEERCEYQIRIGREIRDHDIHHCLRCDLVEHIWRLSEDYRYPQ